MLIIDLTAIKDKENLTDFQKMASTLDMQKVIFLIEGNNDNDLISKLIPFGIYNFANSNEMVIRLSNEPNSYKDVAHYHELSGAHGGPSITMNANSKTRIIGFKNITKEAGATTLVYLSKIYLEQLYNVLVIEIDKEDFRAFGAENVISVAEKDFIQTLNKSTNYDVILVDINNSNTEAYCSEVLYLIEPSIIKLSLLEKTAINISEKLRGKKVVLTKSFLNSSDLSKFEYEGKIRVFFNLPAVNDRSNKNEYVMALYKKLGLDKKDAKKVRKSK